VRTQRGSACCCNEVFTAVIDTRNSSTSASLN
jgi:hypothetical protein